ncbi:MAG: hypothetical protein VXZ82_15490 [Planctomycetota bacterium]|nr:hypothetical protein [Planctomycetota bacterium]
MLEFLPLLFVLTIIALVSFGVVAGSIVAARKRRETLAKFAEDLGLEYQEILPAQDASQFQQFNLANKGRARKATNAVTADSGELRLVIFDYNYTTGSGKNSTTRRQSVVMAFSSSSLQLPHFNISPESFLSKISDFFGFKDIDFVDDKAFSDAFLLHGADEAAVRKFFTPERRKKFFDFRDVSIEARANIFIFYIPRRICKSNEIRGLMERGFAIYTLLSSEE